MNNFQGLGRVFSFTFGQQVQQKGYRSLTVSVALLCVLIPALVLGVMALRAGNLSDGTPEPEAEGWEIPVCTAGHIQAVDETEEPITDWSFLRELHPSSWKDMTYDAADGWDDHTILLRLRQEDGQYRAYVSLPEGSALTQEDAAAYESFLWEAFPAILQVKAGLTAQQLAALTAPITVEPRPQTDELAGVREVLGMLLPYVCMMLMYFLVLFYGQGVANSVILEKTSKLMDFFLVSVQPAAMVLGKVLAIALSGVVQLAVWIVSLVGGFAVGAALCRSLAPDADFAILAFFDSLDMLHGMFSLPAVVLAVGILLGGFLLYCALSGVGGALAGKAEDLSSTNVLFSLVLVASFFCCMFAGGLGQEGVVSSAAWLNFVPFTAILVTPARVLIGQVPLSTALASLGIVLITAVLLCVLAGRVYRMMSLYKGDPPSLQKLLTMLKTEKK